MALLKTPPVPTDPPKSKLESVIFSTPVVLTVLATILAGLSSSEMSSAQYQRSLAAQHQSKASDQWGYFQAKKIRATTLEATLPLLHASPLDADTLQQFNAPATPAKSLDPVEIDKLRLATTRPNTAATRAALAALAKNPTAALPTTSDNPIPDPHVAAYFAAIQSGKSEDDTTNLNQTVLEPQIRQAQNTIDANLAAFDAAAQPTADALAALSAATTSPEPLANALAAAKLRFNAARYAQEAQYNQQAAQLLEILIRRADWSSERHRIRSKRFFYGMLAAQAGVTISTLGLALKRRNLLWALASLAGLTAITLAFYVYLFI